MTGLQANIKQVLQNAATRLSPYSESPALEAEILLMDALGKPRSYLHAWPERMLARLTVENFQQRIERRIAGEPIAHITGEKEFWSLPLTITQDVLIPRPETELLVEITLQQIPEQTALSVADLGTGSGAIAIALASERPDCLITATDISTQALDIAQANAERLKLKNIHFRKSDWYEALEEKQYDIIVSNPPYIAENDPHLNQGDLPHEPVSALISGTDGLDDIRVITGQAKPHLNPGGKLILEHGYNQEEALGNIMQAQGLENIQCYRDLAGLPRVTIATFFG